MLSINNTINTVINNRIDTLSSVYNKQNFFIQFSNSFLTLLNINTSYFTNINDNNMKHILLNYLLKDISLDTPKIYSTVSPTYLKKSLSIVQNVIEPFTITISFYDTPELQLYKQFLNLVKTDFNTYYEMDILKYDFQSKSLKTMYQFGNLHLISVSVDLPKSYDNLEAEIITSVEFVSNILL